jgi:hypothetical protein
MCFISEITEQSFMEFIVAGVCQKLLGEFNFGLCWSSITSTLHEAHIRLCQAEVAVQEIGM